MKDGDVTATLKLALDASGCDRANVTHKPRLLSDNGSSYISSDLADWPEDHDSYRYHESLNNVTHADAYFVRDTAIVERRAKIKKCTMQKHRLFHQQHAA